MIYTLFNLMSLETFDEASQIHGNYLVTYKYIYPDGSVQYCDVEEGKYIGTLYSIGYNEIKSSFEVIHFNVLRT